MDSAKDLSIFLNIGIFVSELKNTQFKYVVALGSYGLIYLDVISICTFCQNLGHSIFLKEITINLSAYIFSVCKVDKESLSWKIFEVLLMFI